MAWRSKRKVMHAYDVTAEIYDERYSEEQHRKYHKALEKCILKVRKCWMLAAAQACSSPKSPQKPNLLLE